MPIKKPTVCTAFAFRCLDPRRDASAAAGKRRMPPHRPLDTRFDDVSSVLISAKGLHDMADELYMKLSSA